MASNTTGSNAVEIYLGGMKVDDAAFISFTVERDVNQPDMASIVLSNQGSVHSSTSIGDSVQVKVGDFLTSIYQGEVVGVEPTFKGGEKSRVLIRAMNKLHRLTKKKKSTTFQNQTDQQILSQVVSDSGLTLIWSHEKTINYKHVYQHNQTNMEFLRIRASRMGCDFWCVDTTVFCIQPNFQAAPVLNLSIDQSSPTGALRSFSPKMSTAPVQGKVTVKGWNPETKELIQGDYTATSSPLGAETAAMASGGMGDTETFTVDQPIESKEEADALAKAHYEDLALQHITATAEIEGDANVDLGQVVHIATNSDPTANPEADPFNGKYYIKGIVHKQSTGSKTGAQAKGFSTELRLARDAEFE